MCLTINIRHRTSGLIWRLHCLNLDWSLKENNEIVWIKSLNDSQWYFGYEGIKWLRNLCNQCSSRSRCFHYYLISSSNCQQIVIGSRITRVWDDSKKSQLKFLRIQWLSILDFCAEIEKSKTCLQSKCLAHIQFELEGQMNNKKLNE